MRVIRIGKSVFAKLLCQKALEHHYPVLIVDEAYKGMERFPKEFCFQLTREEYNSLRSQIVTSKGKGGRRYLPYAFTEQGIAMLSAVLRSDVAIQVSIRIMNTFVEMRRFMANNSLVLNRINELEQY